MRGYIVNDDNYTVELMNVCKRGSRGAARAVKSLRWSIE